MNTKGLFEFINVIYTYDKGKSVVDSLCNGKIRYSSFTSKMFRKRKAFEASVFTCCLENPNFIEQLLIYENRFKKSLEGYAQSHWFDVEYDRLQQPREYFTRKYHEVRKRQIELALVYIEKVKNPKLTDSCTTIETTSVEPEIPHFEGHSVEVIERVFEYLMSKKCLDCNTQKEDFVYYFTGMGEVPTNRLRWCSKKKYIPMFVEELYRNDIRKWEKTTYIFNESKNNYANTLSGIMKRNYSIGEEEFQSGLKKMIKGQ